MYQCKLKENVCVREPITGIFWHYDNNSAAPFHVLSIIGQFMCDSKVGTFSVALGNSCVDKVIYLTLANDYGEMVVASRWCVIVCIFMWHGWPKNVWYDFAVVWPFGSFMAYSFDCSGFLRSTMSWQCTLLCSLDVVARKKFWDFVSWWHLNGYKMLCLPWVVSIPWRHNDVKCVMFKLNQLEMSHIWSTGIEACALDSVESI
jgi:hypothetical protein